MELSSGASLREPTKSTPQSVGGPLASALGIEWGRGLLGEQSSLVSRAGWLGALDHCCASKGVAYNLSVHEKSLLSGILKAQPSLRSSVQDNPVTIRSKALN